MRRIYEINSVRRAGVAGVVAIATVLAGVGVGVAGAASLSAKSSTHSSTGVVATSKKPTTKTNEGHGFNGIVTTYSPGSSITVTNAAGVSATYTIVTSTTYSKDHKTALASAVAMAELVRVTATSTSTTTAANIAILGDGRAKANEGHGVNGIVTAYSAGTSIAVTNSKGVTTTFLLATTTTVTQNHKTFTGVLALGMRVRVVASNTVSTTLSTTATASSIMVLGVAKSNEGHGMNGTVTAYASGASITITNDGVSTTDTINSSTTYTFGAHKAATASDVTTNERVRVITTAANTMIAAHISILGK